jgi:exonuclease VII large subunit
MKRALYPNSRIERALEEYMAGLKASREEFDQRLKASREEFNQRMKEQDERLEKEKLAREERLKQEREEFDRQMKTSREEFDQRMKEHDERLEKERQARELRLEKEKLARDAHLETEKKAEEERRKLHDEEIKFSLEKTERILSKYGNRYGEMIEAMIRPNLKSKFKALGFAFNKLTHDIEAYEEHKILTEIDALLENGDKVMVVEIKSKPSTKDIKEHAKRMCEMRDYADRHGDKRKYYGAMGGMVFCENERNFALGCGFYVIEPSGETFDIIAPEGEYEPRVW